MKKAYRHKKFVLLIIVFGLFIWFVFCLPHPLFDDPTSTILEDNSGTLISAKIADDGQWRFPESQGLPEKYIQSVIHFEDEYFYYHPGINPVSLIRAAKQNIEAGKIVRGGSTISMQAIRLSRKGQPRNLFEKFIEMILAFRLETMYSKDEILDLYASHAPFGGNVVGLEAAAWRYFGRGPSQLSWGETTTLAVLPNAPGLIYPGKNRIMLKQKRDRLLDKLFLNKVIDKETCDLAKSEPLPGAPQHIPRLAPHLLDRAIREGQKGNRIVSTIDLSLQNLANKTVDDYHGVLSQNEIHNLAVLVIDIENGHVLAYAGNSQCPEEGSGRDVDIITSPRSSGSILKPFLYAFMLQEGAILPDALVSDIPTQIAGYSPRNFEETYDGMVPASEALARSLNVPAVRMLQDYGLEKFHHQLTKLNLKTINQPAHHYGLSLILGGAEATLWDLSNEYMRMAQTLHSRALIPEASYMLSPELKIKKPQKMDPAFDPGSVWWTFEALSAVNRPWQETGWQDFESSQKVAWKTGTSFGHRDAWAIGITPKHFVGVWAGNADGEGRPGLTGISTAAPVLFKILKHLPYEKWFQKPFRNLSNVEVCAYSGYPASELCDSTKQLMAPINASRSKICNFHQLIHLDKSEQYRVTGDCYPVHEIRAISWFVLPPVQEWYYKRKNPFYQTLPPYKNGCLPEPSRNMAVIHPKEYTRIFVPRELDGSMGKAVFEIAHRRPESTIYWHLDDKYIGHSEGSHRKEFAPDQGNHKITLVDENGEMLSLEFEIIGR